MQAILGDSEYNQITHGILEALSDKFFELEDHKQMPGFDVEYSDGVLRMNLGDGNNYVINKQPPNKQIWLSSPLCGPKRYNWDSTEKKWINTRDSHCLVSLLNAELKQLTDVDLQLSPKDLYEEIMKDKE
eukprot:CAMPEP_0117073194 /NCGR_PEP_ID=MMETSP0472-20121206/51549_1 /TAXON_ID=693140 ORGANISM="Tiarina fusus, Strain LIS" /NCGR_SAMPLE_ID=MMETSP0472 /ASSEMBLY_ACC=CAM_ASM_000603 /LENGTH=129 /DNA_ID=CAMNT_0004797669 /DNA_START=54 /DNA_END=443 /DNA_ORIENTATION=-